MFNLCTTGELRADPLLENGEKQNVKLTNRREAKMRDTLVFTEFSQIDTVGTLC